MATFFTVWKSSEGFDPDERVLWVRRNNKILFQWIDDQSILILTSEAIELTKKTVTIDGHDITLIYHRVHSTGEDGIPLNPTICPEGTVITPFKRATWTGWYWKDVVDK